MKSNLYSNYSVDSYDETINVRSFSLDAMWGSVGGYIGMVLGFSFYQLPNTFYDGCIIMKTLTEKYIFRKFRKTPVVPLK